MGAIEKDKEKTIENPTEDNIEKIKEESKENLYEKLEKLQGLQDLEESEEKYEMIEDSSDVPLEDHIEESTKELITKSREDRTIDRKKAILGIGIVICVAVIVYVGIPNYYMNHFYFGTEINGVNVSGKTVTEVKEIMESDLNSYTLNIKGLGGEIEQIKANEVGLKYSSDDEVEKLKDTQNQYNWILAYFTKENPKITVELLYDDKLLNERINNLSCFDSNNIIDPKNPGFEYVNNSYVVVDEVIGYKVDKEILYSHVENAIINRDTEIDLRSIAQEIRPEYTAKSRKIIEVRNILNKYVSSKITYTFGHIEKSLDGSIINKWLTVDENLEIIFDEEKVRYYINGIFDTYNTIGDTREFITSSGETIRIGGGDYGWSINEVKEAENLILAIKEGTITTIEPQYSQTAFSHGVSDIGDTYVEIDLENQYMWFYKKGSLIVEGNIVTGNVKANHTTPKGVYRLKYKAKNVVLRGPGYASPVTFWMPFNGGIGIHDANWRSEFGGNIYLTNGSHGCINSPYDVAKEIFNNIEPGTPVICY